jgi:hypothetical protein
MKNATPPHPPAHTESPVRQLLWVPCFSATATATAAAAAAAAAAATAAAAAAAAAAGCCCFCCCNGATQRYCRCGLVIRDIPGPDVPAAAAAAAAGTLGRLSHALSHALRLCCSGDVARCAAAAGLIRSRILGLPAVAGHTKLALHSYLPNVEATVAAPTAAAAAAAVDRAGAATSPRHCFCHRLMDLRNLGPPATVGSIVVVVNVVVVAIVVVVAARAFAMMLPDD